MKTVLRKDCWLEVKCSGMFKWESDQQAFSGGRRGHRSAQHSANVKEEEDEPKLTISDLPIAACIDKNGKNGLHCRDRIWRRPSGSAKEDSAAQPVSTVTEDDIEQKVMITEAPIVTSMNKEKRRIQSPISGRAGKHTKLGESKQKRKQINRWSAQRYKSAEQNMLEIMKDEGAVFEKPISRHVLRTAARQRIGDTGLLDHLLKCIDNKVAPGGVERFRRCYNTEGVMVYWLENVDTNEAAVHDHDRVPPVWWKSGNVIQEPGEVNLLKHQTSKMSNMHECKQELQDKSDVLEKMHMEFVGWRTNIDQQIMEMSKTVTSMNDMYKELISWKVKTEQQLLAICNSFNSVQTSNTCTSFSPTPERWEDWLYGTKFDNIQGGDLETWFENTNFTGFVPPAVGVQEPHSYVLPLPNSAMIEPSKAPFPVGELKSVKDEITSTERNMQELLLNRRLDGVVQDLLLHRRSDGDQTNMTPDSSFTANMKSDTDNSAIPSQEILEEMLNWKAKVEQQLMEISSAVVAMQTRK